MKTCATVRGDICTGVGKVNFSIRDVSIIKLLKITAICLFLILSKQTGAYAQINFGEFHAYSLQLFVDMDQLIFDGPIISGSGYYDVTLVNAVRVDIEGIKYLDVGVLITVDGKLFLDGDDNYFNDPQRSIPFELKARYANVGVDDTENSVPIAITNDSPINVGEARFPILSRQFLPPGPPPPPPTDSEEFANSLVENTGSAYLYLYGTINVSENVVAGEYSGYINISVQYDGPPSN